MQVRNLINRRSAAGLAAAGALGLGVLGAAGPAFAAGNPSSSAQATVTVTQSISFAFDSSPSFALSPNVTSHGAVAFTVSTNDSHGYAVSLAAPDLLDAGGTLQIAASALSYRTLDSGGGDANPAGTLTLGNAPATAFSATQATNGSHFTQDWTASLPANTPPGAYSTQITYVAVAA